MFFKKISNEIEAEEPIFLKNNTWGEVTGSETLARVAIREAGQEKKGALRFATQEEVNEGTLDNVAISPLTLQNYIKSINKR